MKFNFKYLELEFIESAAEFNQCLHHDMQEIAFEGASNAGKSSAINAISNQKKLAKTSKSPGKTKLFNFFKAKNGYIVENFNAVNLKVGIEWLSDFQNNRINEL